MDHAGGLYAKFLCQFFLSQALYAKNIDYLRYLNFQLNYNPIINL